MSNLSLCVCPVSTVHLQHKIKADDAKIEIFSTLVWVKTYLNEYCSTKVIKLCIGLSLNENSEVAKSIPR